MHEPDTETKFEPEQEPDHVVQQIQLPIIPIEHVTVDVIDAPAGNRAIVFGPLMLALPLDDKNGAEIAEKLTKVRVETAPASALDALKAGEPLNRAQRRELARQGAKPR